jgi:hypothetical protein
MARITYEGLKNGDMSDDSVCRGLHNASRRLRDQWPRSLEPIRKTRGEAEIINSQNKLKSTKRHKSRRLSTDDEEVDKPLRDIMGLSDSDDDCVNSKPPHWVPYAHFGI